MGSTVELPQWMVVGGAVLVVGSVATAAFFLGQSTAPSPVVPTQVVSLEPTPPAPTAGVPPSGAPVETDGAPEAREDPASMSAHASSAPADAQPAPALAAAPPAPASKNAGSSSVRAYFASLDRIGGIDPSGVDSNALIQQALSGDVSGIDRIIDDHRKRQLAIQRLSPPSACRAYHTALSQLAADGLTVMQKLRAGILSQDVQALMGLQGSAMRLQAAGDALQRQEAALRQEHGLR